MHSSPQDPWANLEDLRGFLALDAAFLLEDLARCGSGGAPWTLRGAPK